ncbi:hypothetical protein HK098_003632 [Nowakowskiella sp. JEL0407]|nr:hypothetical protein HK098_003632 [Nowakowskiella sp. JEL0407]
MKSSRNFMGLRRTPSKKDDPEAKLSKKIGARGSLADIICFSSCKDYQEASDNDHALDGPQGALTGAVLPILEQKGDKKHLQIRLCTHDST